VPVVSNDNISRKEVMAPPLFQMAPCTSINYKMFTVVIRKFHQCRFPATGACNT
jgi:hypothetical protein